MISVFIQLYQVGAPRFVEKRLPDQLQRPRMWRAAGNMAYCVTAVGRWEADEQERLTGQKWAIHTYSNILSKLVQLGETVNGLLLICGKAPSSGGVS